MKIFLRRSACAVLFFVSFALRGGYVGYICPAGAKAGTTCEVIIGGRGLGAIRQVIVDGSMSDRDVTVEAVDVVPRRLHNIQKPEQKKYVGQCIRAVFQGKPMPALPQDTTGWDSKSKYLTAVDRLTAMQREMLVRGFFTRPDRLQLSPSIASKAVVRLRIAPNAKKGLRHLRFTGNGAVFNPIPFFIGDKPEVFEPLSLPPPGKPPVPLVTLPAVLNGRILPREADSFRFQAQKGQCYTFRLYGRALLPFIGDGVPGHFQPVLQILNRQGKEVAFRDDTYFDPDPVLIFNAPDDGEYTLIVRDAIYRGREDFVYRIDVSEGSRPYELLQLPDWKLPLKKIGADAETFQVAFPCAVEGTIMPGKSQKVRFALKKGAPAVLEIYARRALSPLDSRLRLFGPDGKVIAVNDDFPRPKIGPVYHHADSYLRFTAQEDGVYTAEISDTAGAGGNDYRYRLRISEPRPDFRIWSVPSGMALHLKGGSTPVGFVAERLDGHADDIVIQVGKSKNVTLSGSNVLPYGEKRANSFESVCGVQAPFPDCAKEFLTVALLPEKKSKARMEQFRLTARSGDITHPVIPADESMQAFAYNHLIEADDSVAVMNWNHGGKFSYPENDGFRRNLTIGQEMDLRIEIGEKIVANSCSAELYAPPAGFSLVDCRQMPDAVILRVKADKFMKPFRFNQIIRINFARKYMDRKTKTLKTGRDSVFLPALLFELKEP